MNGLQESQYSFVCSNSNNNNHINKTKWHDEYNKRNEINGKKRVTFNYSNMQTNKIIMLIGECQK